ncbi:MAG: cell division protein FtsQ/DivIB [Lentihominibacter sp.]
MSEKKKRRKKRPLLTLLIIVAIFVCAGFVMHIDYFDLTGVAVIGNKDIPDEEIIRLSEIETGKSVFDVHPLLVQHKIKKNLYVESVNVDRVLPDRVEIHITERACTAQFIKGKKYVVTASDGMVIDITDKEQKATLVEGITVKEAELKKDIKVKEENAFEDVMKFIRLTHRNDLYFKRIVMDDSRMEAYVYDGLKCVGEYDDMADVIKSGTLKNVIYDLYQKDVEKGTVNVYGNDYCSFTK